MSFQLMKERIKQSGATLYDEQIKDAQDILAYGFGDDVSYNKNIVGYKTNEEIPIKIYDRKYSVTYGFTSKFLTLHDMPIELGKLLYDTKSDEYWMCIETYDVDGIHNKGKLAKCLRFLKWQDEDGIIQEIPIIVTSASKYNNGEYGNQTITIASDQLLLFMQLNEDTVKLDRGKRFFIDENKDNPSVYELTRTDTALYSYMGVGYISMIVTEDQYTPKKEDLEHGVCDYFDPTTPLPPPDPTDETVLLWSRISGGDTLRVGINRIFRASFKDKNGDTVNWIDVDFSWNIVGDIKIQNNIYSDVIELLVDDDSYVEESFLLQLFVDGKLSSEIEIFVTDTIM